MLAKPTSPPVSTVFDVRMRRPERTYNDSLFSGWGVSINTSRPF